VRERPIVAAAHVAAFIHLHIGKPNHLFFHSFGRAIAGASGCIVSSDDGD
jgi:hypothetical protein